MLTTKKLRMILKNSKSFSNTIRKRLFKSKSTDFQIIIFKIPFHHHRPLSVAVVFVLFLFVALSYFRSDM